MIGVALVHVVLGTATLRGRISREVSLLLLAVGIGLSAIGAALALDGPALVAAWSVEAVLLAWLARRMERDRGYVAAVGFLAAASVHVLVFDARPDRLLESPEWFPVVAILLVTTAAAIVSRLYRGAWSEFRDALDLLALGGLAYLVPIALEGAPVVVAWALFAVALALLTRRGLVELGGIAPALFVGLAGAHTLLIEAPPLSLRDGVDDLGSALLAIAVTTIAALVGARLSPDPLDKLLTLTGALGSVYLPSVAIVDLTSGGSCARPDPAGAALGVLGPTGLAAVVYGLVLDDKRLRFGGLGLLGLAAAKVILYDLKELDEIYRVLSFIALGLLLLAGAFAYQRIRKVERLREVLAVLAVASARRRCPAKRLQVHARASGAGRRREGGIRARRSAARAHVLCELRRPPRH